jgi:ribosomal protein S15P/S13E
MTQPEPTTDQLRAQIDQLQAANNTGIQTLAKRGIQLNGPDTLNLTVRLEALAEHLCGPQDNASRLSYEMLVQEKFAKLIDEAPAQAARATLLAPGNINGAQLPGHRP